jgi:deoxyribonuclease-4
MAAKSYGYVLDTAKVLKIMGGKRVVFHPAAQGKAAREEAVSLTEDRMKILRDYIYLNDMQDMIFCPETMGKLAQIGTVEEIARFCKIDPVFVPCVDFGHINAREQGSLKTVQDYKERLEYLIAELGYERMKNFHVHFSKIMYSAKGEVKHLTFEDDVYGPEFLPLAVALKELSLEPFIVSESAGTQAEDAISMKTSYESLF